MNFNPAQPFFSVVIAWIRLPGLPGYMYKRKILLEIGGIVGSVTKFDLNTDSWTRGRFARMVVYVSLDKPLISKVLVNGSDSWTRWRFARMVVYVSLDKPLISKVLVNGKPQRVEYEFLSSVCFECGRYRYIKLTCLNGHLERNAETEAPQIVSKLEESKTAHKGSDIDEGPYGPWMLVERKVRRRSRDNKVTGAGNLENTFIGSRFMALFSLNKDMEEFDLKNKGTRGAKNKGKETLANATQWARLMLPLDAK